jgi:hypothetical protein
VNIVNRFSAKNSKNIMTPIQIAIERPSQTTVGATKVETKQETDKNKHKRKKHRSKSLHHTSRHRRSSRQKQRSNEDNERNEKIHASNKKRHLKEDTSQYGKRTSPTFQQDLEACQSSNQRIPSVVTSLPHGFQPVADETIVQRKSPISPETGYIRQLKQYHQSNESAHLQTLRTQTPFMPLPGQVSACHVEKQSKDSLGMKYDTSYRSASSYGHPKPHSSNHTNRKRSNQSSVHTPSGIYLYYISPILKGIRTNLYLTNTIKLNHVIIQLM